MQSLSAVHKRSQKHVFTLTCTRVMLAHVPVPVYLITFKMVQEYSHKQDIHGHHVTRISPAEEVCTSNPSNLCKPSIFCCWGVLPKLLKGSSLNGVGPRATNKSFKGCLMYTIYIYIYAYIIHRFIYNIQALPEGMVMLSRINRQIWEL